MATMTSEISRLGPAAERVFRALRAEIDDGRLPVHARLPTERELSQRFQVSRLTIHRAMARLGQEGRIATRQGAGSHVCPTEPARGTQNTISVMCGSEPPDLAALSSLALRHGCMLAVYAQEATLYDSELERVFLERVLQQRHRALLAACTPRPPHHEAQLAALAAAGTRVVHLEPYQLAPPAQSFLLPDYQRAGRAATTALLMAGFRRIIGVGMSTDGPCFQLIRRGVQDVLADQGLLPDPVATLDDDPRQGAWFYQAPRHTPAPYAERWDLLAQLLTEPTGLVVGGLTRAAELREELARRGVPARLRLRVIAIEVSPSEAAPYPAGETYYFARGATHRRVVELVTQPDFPGLREWLPPLLATATTPPPARAAQA